MNRLLVFLTLSCVNALANASAVTIDVLRGDDLTATFHNVARHLAFAPYKGVLRGGNEAVAAGSANSLDQAITLALAIAPQVEAYRFARGELTTAQAVQLLSSNNAPPIPAGTFPSDRFDLYSPTDDETRLERVRDHYWLEVQPAQGDDWIALDPSFPTLAFGEAITHAIEHVAAPPREMMHQLTLTLMQETGAGVRKLGGVGGAVARLALSPISLEMMAAPASRAPTQPADDGSGDLQGLAGGFAGALSGRRDAAPSKSSNLEGQADGKRSSPPPDALDVTYRLHFAGKDVQIPSHQVHADDPASHIHRVWLEFTLVSPGRSARRLERAIYEADQSASPLDAAGHRRYAALVTTGAISDARFAQAWDESPVRLKAEEWASKAQALTEDEIDEQSIIRARTLEHETSIATGHLAALSFAHQSDKFSAALARRTGVRVVHDQPRVLLVSLESTQPEGNRIRSEVNIDLRLDEVDAIPLDGAPLGAARLFQRARGLQESSLEGAVLARLTGSETPVVTTVALMEAARAQGYRDPLGHTAATRRRARRASAGRGRPAPPECGTRCRLPPRSPGPTGGTRGRRALWLVADRPGHRHHDRCHARR
jgi:hypothetical protein